MGRIVGFFVHISTIATSKVCCTQYLADAALELILIFFSVCIPPLRRGVSSNFLLQNEREMPAPMMCINFLKLLLQW